MYFISSLNLCRGFYLYKSMLSILNLVSSGCFWSEKGNVETPKSGFLNALGVSSSWQHCSSMKKSLLMSSIYQESIFHKESMIEHREHFHMGIAPEAQMGLIIICLQLHHSFIVSVLSGTVTVHATHHSHRLPQAPLYICYYWQRLSCLKHPVVTG